MENLPPLFFRTRTWRRWWLWPLVALPETIVASWLHRRLRARLAPALAVPKDLWDGQGVLLLYSIDPQAFGMRTLVERALLRFPKAILAVHADQAAWWQAFFPGTQVRSLPGLDLWDPEDLAWLERELPALQGDWCWNLREDEHPFSRALTRILGRSWRIGKGPAPWANLSIEPPEGSPALSGARIRTLAGTFGWAEIATSAPKPGKATAFHVPAVVPKKLVAWQESAQELVRTRQALVFQSGTVGGLGALESKALPEAEELLRLAPSLSRWIGPWDQNAGALAACGVEVVVVGRVPKGSSLRQVQHPRPGQASSWCQELDRA